MRVVDSREAQGPGILILQDHRGIDPDVRGAILAVRITGRDEMGVYEVGSGSYGDVVCATCWPKDGRPMPGWGFAFSVLAVEGGTITRAGTGGSPPESMLPAKGPSSGRVPDSRFAVRAMGYPITWPSFPRGWSGIAVSGTKEDKQEIHWHPTDPRLVSPHRGLGKLSSIVTDVAGVEPDLAARLATHLVVLNRPAIGGGGGGRDGDDGNRVAAWGTYGNATNVMAGVTGDYFITRQVFGFNPPTLHFPMTPGFSASGERLSQTPHLNGLGDVVYGYSDREEDGAGGGGSGTGGGSAGGGGSGGQAPAGNNPAAAAEEAAWAAYENAVSAALAGGASEDEAWLAGQKARGKSLMAAHGSGAMAGGGGGSGGSGVVGGSGEDGAGADGPQGEEGAAGPNGEKGGLSANALAWLIGLSNGFKGGFVLDNPTPDVASGGSTGGGGDYRGPGTSAPPVRPRGEDTRSTTSTGSLPPGAGNLVRSSLTVSTTGLTGAGGPIRLGSGTTQTPGNAPPRGPSYTPVPPAAASLASLGITIGRGGNGKIVALVSANDGGFLHAGGVDDAHKIGSDGDGNSINPAHLSIQALIYADKERDGPFAWWPDQPSAQAYESPAHVQLGFDGRQGRWTWVTFLPFERVYESDNPPPPPDTPGRGPRPPTTPPVDPPPPPRRPGRGGDPGNPQPDPPGPQLDTPFIGGVPYHRAYVGHWSEEAFPVLLGRPQSQMGGVVDMRAAVGFPAGYVEEARRTPIVARIEAYGPQKGEGWERTHAEGVIYRGGTAPGGFVVLPPEARLEDTEPAGVTISTAYFAIGTGARLGWGTPLLTSGGLASGWSARLVGSTLVFASHDSAGALTTRVGFLASAIQIDAAKVVGPRITGWQAATGTATRTTFATATVTLEELAQRVKALIDDLHETAGHGLIGT